MNKFGMAMVLLKLWLLLVWEASVVITEELLVLMMCKECPEIQTRPWDEWMKKHEDLWTR